MARITSLAGVHRHQVLIKRMEFKVAKLGHKRVTFYKFNPVTKKTSSTGSWMTRKDFRMLSGQKAFTINKTYRNKMLPKGWVKPKIRFKPLRVTAYIKKDGKFIKRQVSFKVASNEQRRYIFSMLQRKKIPLNDPKTSQRKIIVDMAKPMREAGIGMWSHAPSP